MLFGTPHYNNVLRNELYKWQDINTKLINNGFGFYTIISNNNGIKKFIATLMLNIENHNRKILELYRIKDKNEWEKLIKYYEFELIDWVKTISLNNEKWDMMELMWVNNGV